MSTPRPLVFLDLETTGLHPATDHIWEFAAIRREPEGCETIYHAFVQHDAEKAAALPEPFRADHDARYDPTDALAPAEFVIFAHVATRDAVVVGACPWFDAGFLERYLRDAALAPAWHHRLIDVESLAAGHLRRPVHGLADAAQALGVDPGVAHKALDDAMTARDVYDAVIGDHQ